MKKGFGALGRIFCAFLSASTILTSIPQTAMAAEMYTPQMSETNIETEEMPTFASTKSSYTVSFDTSKMALDTSMLEDMQGIIYENGKCYISKDADSISVVFKLKKGYFIAKDDENGYKVNVTIDGAETDEFTFEVEEETAQLSIDVYFPLDDSDNSILGNVEISPTFVTYKKVTFSFNNDHISEIYVDGENTVVEGDKKTFEWLEGDEHYFSIDTYDGFEITAVKYGSSVLEVDEHGLYNFVVTGDSGIEITTSSDKSSYTVSWDTKLMTIIPDKLDGCLYEGGKCYVRKDYSSISLNFKVKNGYGVSEDEDGNYDVKVSIKGSKPEGVSCSFYEEESTLEVNISFPTDKKTNTILGDVTIAPVIKPYRKVTFSGNFKHIYSIVVDDFSSIDEESEDGDKTFLWLEKSEHIFTIDVNDGYEVKSVKYGSSELKPDKDGKYKLIVSADTKVVITTSSDRSNYTVTCDSKLMTLITSDENYELDGCVYENGKCYIRKNVTSIELPFKVKSGYYVPCDDEENYQVSVSIKGSAPRYVEGRFDSYDNVLRVNIDFSLDKNDDPILGDITITPVIKQYKKVTFSCNYKQIYWVSVKGYDSAYEDDKTVLVRGDEPLVFEIETIDGYEVRSVTCESKELVANENFEYSFTVTKDTTVKITSGKFSGPVLDPVEVKFYLNNKELAELPSNMTVENGLTFDKKAKKYYTTKATTGTYQDIYIGVKGNETDEYDKVVYKYGNAKIETRFWPGFDDPGKYYAYVENKAVKKAVIKGLPIHVYLYINMPKHTLKFTGNDDISNYCEFFMYVPGGGKHNDLSEVKVIDGDDYCFAVDDSFLREYEKKKVTCVTCNGKKLTPKKDGKSSYYELKNITKDYVIKPVIKPLSAPEEPEEPDPENPDDPEEPGEEKDYFEVKISSDEGISQVRAVANGCYLKNQSGENGSYTYQIPKKSSVKLYVSPKDKYEIKQVLQDGSKAVKPKDGAVTLKLKADTEIAISSEALSYLYYQKVSDKEAKEVVCDSGTCLKAASCDVYELYVKKGNDILPISKVSITGLSKHPGFATLSSDKKKVTIACHKAVDIKKTISVTLSCDGLKKEKKISFSIYRPITKVSVQGFKNNKVSQAYGSSVSYKVSIDEGADYRDIKLYGDYTGEEYARLYYDPERGTVTVDTFKGDRLSENPVYFYFTDSAGNMVGDKYEVEPVAAKLDKCKAQIVDVRDDEYTLAVQRPRGTEGLKNLYYEVSIRDPFAREDDWGMITSRAIRRYEAKDGVTEITASLNKKLFRESDSGKYEINIFLCQYRDKLDDDPGNTIFADTLSESKAFTMTVNDTAAYYEKKLKLNSKTKAFLWGEKNITLAAAAFSKKTNCRRIAKVTIEGVSQKDKYSSEDKKSIISIDNVKGLITLLDSAKLYPGKYTLNAYPSGDGKAAKISFTVKAPVTSIEITAADNTLYKSAGKAATKKLKVTCKSTVNGKEYKPAKTKVKYTITSDNEELLKAVSVKNGVVTVKKGYCLDYDEANNRFTVTVTATDLAGGKGTCATASQEFVVTKNEKSK